MIGNFHVRFLGGKGAVMPPTYPANGCLRRIVIDKRQCLPLQWKHSFVRSIHVFIESTKLFICNYKDKMPFFR